MTQPLNGDKPWAGVLLPAAIYQEVLRLTEGIQQSRVKYDAIDQLHAFARFVIKHVGTRSADAALTALRELVACKDLKEKYEAIKPRDLSAPRNYYAEELEEQYKERQPKAWKAARAALDGASSATTALHEHDWQPDGGVVKFESHPHGEAPHVHTTCSKCGARAWFVEFQWELIAKGCSGINPKGWDAQISKEIAPELDRIASETRQAAQSPIVIGSVGVQGSKSDG